MAKMSADSKFESHENILYYETRPQALAQRIKTTASEFIDFEKQKISFESILLSKKEKAKSFVEIYAKVHR